MQFRSLIVPLLLLAGAEALADSDAQLWLNGELRYRPVKTVTLSIDEQLRLDQNASRLNSIISDLSGSWRLQKWLRLGLGYRFEMESNKKDELESAQRLHVQSRLKYALGPVALSYRVRLQEKHEPDGDETERTRTLRHRFALAVDRGGDLEPGFSVETFNRLGEDGTRSWRKLRLTLGTEIRGPKPHRFQVFYRAEMPLADPDDPLEHIGGLGYQYRIPRKKKKKKKN